MNADYYSSQNQNRAEKFPTEIVRPVNTKREAKILLQAVGFGKTILPDGNFRDITKEDRENQNNWLAQNNVCVIEADESLAILNRLQ